MSIAAQLNKLKTPLNNFFAVNSKNKVSLIYKDGNNIGRAEALRNSRKGFLKLCEKCNKFNQFEDLYSEDKIDLVPQLLKETEFNEIQRKIKQFVCLLTPYLEIDFVIVAFEWLVYKYEIHINQPYDVLMACLPYHRDPIFIKYIRLLNTEQKEFSWLNSISLEGKPILPEVLSSVCLKNPHLLEMICNWPMKILKLVNNVEEEFNQLYHTLIVLENNIINNVKSKGNEKVEKYLGPFTRLIVDGLESTNENLYYTVLILLERLSEIRLDENLLKYSIKKILTSDIIEPFNGLNFIINLCARKDYTLNEELQKLCQKNINKLDDESKKVIEKMMMENEEMEVENSTTVIEIEENKPIVNSLPKFQVIWDNIKDTINIEWSKDDIEEQLCCLLSKYVLNWEELNKENNCQNKGIKIGLNILKLIKSNKPKEMKFKYKTNGLISHLHFAIMHSNYEIKKIVLKILKSFSSVRPEILNILNDFKNGVDIIFNKKAYRLILTELNTLAGESASLTMITTIIRMIHSKNIPEIPKYENIWSIFLSKFNPNISLEEMTFEFCDVFRKCLDSISNSFCLLTESDQQSILLSLTNNLNRNGSDFNKTIDFLSRLNLSIENYKFLLKDATVSTDQAPKRKSMKKFKSEPSLSFEFYKDEILDKINVVLSVFCRNNSMSVDDQLVLLEIVLTVFGRIISHLSRNKLSNSDTHEPCSDNNMIDLVTNIMSSVLSILTSVINSTEKVNLDSISNKIRLEVFSKCLYLFKNSNLNELNLMVIQTIVKLNLGSDHFNLIYFISWIGNHLVPKEDQNSLNILNSIINETLQLCIKQKKQDSGDRIKIIIKFIHECASLPKHRVLLLYKSIVNSLSLSKEGGDDCKESVLWIQLLFMIASKPQTTAFNINNFNDCLIIPLLKKFSIEEQILTLEKIILFLSNFVHDPSRKRKFNETDHSDSPLNKKIKTDNTMLMEPININKTELKKSVIDNKLKDFASVKENLLTVDKNLDSISLLKTFINYAVIHIKESSDSLLTVSENLKDFISSIFVSMKIISHSNLPISQQNSFFQHFRQIIEQIGLSLSRNYYLSLIVDLSIKETDESIKSKCLELLGSKLSSMATSKNNFCCDQELDGIVCSIVPMICEIILDKVDSCDWNTCLLCATKLVALGFMSKEIVETHCTKIFTALLDMNFDNMIPDKVVLINMFFKNYIVTDKYNELTVVFECCLKMMNKCIDNKELNNGELESCLSLMHSIVSREDSELIGWEMFGKLLENIFLLVSLDYKLKKLSKQSCDYQRYIRIKLSKTKDTTSLINASCELIKKGLTFGDVSYISGSISLFTCHLNHLNKMNIVYGPDNDKDIDTMWNIVYRSLSFNENDSLKSESNLDLIKTISIKALNQLCVLLDFDQDIIKKLLNFTQESDITPEFYLERNSAFFMFISYLISKSNYTEKTIEFVNNSDYISCASIFLKHLSIETQSKTKRRKTQSAFVIKFSSETLTTDCPKQCGELIKSICDALLSHLRAENKLGMNLSISDETIDLISNICRCMSFIDQYLDKTEYEIITDKYMIPLIVQIATNSFNDEALLRPLGLGLCKHYSEVGTNVHLAILKTLADLKTCLGNVFESSIRNNISSFLDACQLDDNEMIYSLAISI